MQTIILIPPSEGKSFGGELAPLTQTHLITLKLIERISKVDPNKLYGLKKKALEEAKEINKTILISKTCSAIERYTGVVYDGIDYKTIKNKKLFNKQVRIVSALFGIIKPQSLIPNYKLKIDKLQAAKEWKEENSKQLKNLFVIDLLPQSHKKAISYKKGIEVEFIHLKNGKKMLAGHQGKHIKGRFIRWLIETNISNPKDFLKFSEDGYCWNGNYFIKE